MSRQSKFERDGERRLTQQRKQAERRRRKRLDGGPVTTSIREAPPERTLPISERACTRLKTEMAVKHEGA